MQDEPNGEGGHETPRSSSSPVSQNQSWAPPKSPLPPYRLAKLANALGISTPLPAHLRQHPFTTSTPNLASPFPGGPPASPLPGGSPASPAFRRSPTPSSQPWSATPTVGPTSRYLLHIVPPPDLPHDTDALTPTPPTASGYHAQFRRGVMVPLHQSLQSQLSAIAREYALPSTVGLVLYLILPSTHGQLDAEDPGPRISEEMWKHVWIKALRAEQTEFAPSRSPTPLFARQEATPLSPQMTGSSVQPPATPLRALMSQRTVDLSHSFQFPMTPSSSAPSSASSHLQRNLSTSTAASLPIPRPNRSDSDPAPLVRRDSESSVAISEPETDALGFTLSGLASPGIVPILAKVEFDIDKRRAAWYEPWIRSRRNNQRKRKESFASARSREGSVAEGSSVDDGERERHMLELGLVRKLGVQAFLRTGGEDGYAPKQDEPEDDPTMTFPVPAEVEDDGPDSRRTTIRRTVTANAAELVALPTREDEDEDDVGELSEQMFGEGSSPGRKRSSTSTTLKKRVPPPLKFANGVPEQAEGDSGLPYLSGESPDTSPDKTARKRADSLTSPEDKRGGVFFDDLELGLEPSLQVEEWDEDDPNDRRKSQFLMKAQLDEIERTLNQLSPHNLNMTFDSSRDGSNLSPKPSHGTSLSVPNSAGFPVPQPSNRASASTRTATLRSASISGLSINPAMSMMQEEAVPQWPAVPYSMARTPSPYSDAGSEGGFGPNDPASPPGPPRLTINGVGKEIPYPVNGARDSSGQMSEETRRRKRELEQEGIYPPLGPPSRQRGFDSPVIPLSPDPFGRFASHQESDPRVVKDNHRARQDSYGGMARISEDRASQSTTYTQSSSRFSTDSVDLGSKEPKESKGSAPIVSVNSIKKLWRRSNKNSVSSTTGRPPGSPWAAESFQRDQLDRPPLPKSPGPGQMMQGSNGNGHFGDAKSTDNSPRPSLSMSRPGTSMSSASGSVVMPGSAPPPTTTEEKRNTARKSILKTWKSAASSLAQQSQQQAPPDAANGEAKRKRRPSMFDTASAVMAGRHGSQSGLDQIPPSPHLPEHFRVPSMQSPPRTRTSKHGPTASTASRHSPLPPLSPPLPSSPPRNGALSASSSRPSYDSSFDTSEFEMVNAPQGIPTHQSYYHSTDHSFTPRS